MNGFAAWKLSLIIVAKTVCVYSYHENLSRHMKHCITSSSLIILNMMKSILILLSLQAYYCLAFSAQSAVSKSLPSNINHRRSQSSNIVLSSSTNNDEGPLGFLQGILPSLSSAVAVAPEPDFVVDSDYTIAAVSFEHMMCTYYYI